MSGIVHKRFKLCTDTSNFFGDLFDISNCREGFIVSFRIVEQLANGSVLISECLLKFLKRTAKPLSLGNQFANVFYAAVDLFDNFWAIRAEAFGEARKVVKVLVDFVTDPCEPADDFPKVRDANANFLEDRRDCLQQIIDILLKLRIFESRIELLENSIHVINGNFCFHAQLTNIGNHFLNFTILVRQNSIDFRR